METAQLVGNPEQKPQFTVVETDRDPLYISLSQAARIWHKHKGTISRHVKDGKLQWHDQPDGEKKLFAPEIAHLYGPPPSDFSTGADRMETAVVQAPATAAANSVEGHAVHALLEAKDEMIRVLQSQLEREREVADQWRREFASIKDHMLALPGPAVDKQRKKWWPF